MFESKDASKSDERRVKNTPNSKPLTRKRKGETHTMGNRGIQLSVFFVISLMLIATVFSSTAMAAANDGEGAVSVLFAPSTGSPETMKPTAIATAPTSPQDAGSEVAAGSRYNVVQLTYTAMDEESEGINMSGGRVRIMFPNGWGDMTKLVRVQELTDGIDPDDSVGVNAGTEGDPINGVIYQTDGDGDLDESLFTGDLEDTANAAVTLSGSSITINLGSGWGRRPPGEAGRSIRIIISRATAGKVKDAAEFRSSSSAKNGNLRRLGANPSVPVGNILGIRLTTSDKDTFVDPLDRKVEISPIKVYPGEKRKKITITFTAPGPMGSDGDPAPDADPAVTREDAYETLTIGIPVDLRPDADFEDDDKGDLFNTEALHDGTSGIKVAARGGAVLGMHDATSPATSNPRVNADDELEIDIKSISEGQTIIVTYTTDIPSAAIDVNGSPYAFAAGATSPASAKDTGTTFTASLEAADVTTIKGGLIGESEGAGKLEVKPISLEQGSKGRSFTVTYTAYSSVTTSIVIKPAGIVIDDLDPTDDVVTELQDDTPGAYGYVRTTTTSNKGGLNVTSDTITWENAALVAGDKVVIIISKVDVVAEPDNYEWETTVDGEEFVLEDDATTEDVNEVGSLSVVKTSADTVKFDIQGVKFLPSRE